MDILKTAPLLVIIALLGALALLSDNPFEDASLYLSNEPAYEAQETKLLPLPEELPEAVSVPPESLADEEALERVPAEEENAAEVNALQEAEVASASKSRYPTEGVFAPVNTIARYAVVNILCEMKLPRSTRTITGSGIIIDPRGVILTNAHIGQFFLLKDYPERNATTCTIRTGNPAEAAYRAEPIFISPTWIAANAEKINESNPTGTGENDFALLYITETVGQKVRPQGFVFLDPVLGEAVSKDEQLLLVSYPAFFSDQESVAKELFQVSALARVTKLFTFGDQQLDLFGLSGTVASYNGSSGGAVANRFGHLVGLIVASTESDVFVTRELRALTPAHINRVLTQEASVSLPTLLSGDLDAHVAHFNDTIAQVLTNTLVHELEKEE